MNSLLKIPLKVRESTVLTIPPPSLISAVFFVSPWPPWFSSLWLRVRCSMFSAFNSVHLLTK